jgi:PAS domain S-box-containing protein
MSTEAPGAVPASAALAAALDHHAIVAITDRRGLITHVNDRFCAISGYCREELIGRDHRLLNSGHHPREYMRDMWRRILRGEVWHGEFRNRAKDGRHYWVQSTIVPIAGDDGRPREFIAIRTEVTAHRRTEAELAASESRFRRLFELSSDALLLLDVDQGRFVDANLAAARMLGFEHPAALVGCPPQALSPPVQDDGQDSASKARQMIESAVAAGSHRFEWLHCSERRAPFPVEVLLTPITLDGQRLLFVTWRDISQRRQQRQWTQCSSQALDLLARRAPLADVLAPLLDFAVAQHPGTGLAVIRHSAIALRPELVAAQGLDTSLLASLVERREHACAGLLGVDAECPPDCPTVSACGEVRAGIASGQLRVEPLVGDDGELRASLVSRRPAADIDAEWLGATPRALWLDLLRLVLQKEATRETESLFRAVFEHSADGVAMCERAGRLLLANPALGRMRARRGRSRRHRANPAAWRDRRIPAPAGARARATPPAPRSAAARRRRPRASIAPEPGSRDGPYAAASAAARAPPRDRSAALARAARPTAARAARGSARQVPRTAAAGARSRSWRRCYTRSPDPRRTA